MAITTLKPFQQRAVDSAVTMFDYLRSTLDAAGEDATSRATAIHGNGYLLIEAPTGAGKTLMAGSIVERVSAADKVVWFWFAPFKGVVDQSAAFLREQFHGLRLRTLSEDRTPIGARAGDAFVTTWQMVATRVKDRRSVRQTGEQNDSIDDLIVSLREQGFRIGVVVDEAHHGFHGDTLAAAFFREVLNPEYTILVTATPDDEDLKDLQKRMQLGGIRRISVSRADAVGPGPEAGLIKNGVKAIAWRAGEGSEALVDFEATALREAKLLHEIIKAKLREASISLVPLMLVQVDSKPKAVERAKDKLKELGFTESQIAVHTSDEPDPSLLALANDESKEILIFKMAVALGFDAPRAWTLVSSRSAKDEDFGVQLVGRILRVHRRVQGQQIPEELRYGYVLLANIDAQGGLDKAGQVINRIQTAYATVSPTTIVVQVGSRTMVQKQGPDGQITLVPVAPEGAFYHVPPQITSGPSAAKEDVWGPLFSGEGGGPTSEPTFFRVGGALGATLVAPAPGARFSYPLKEGVPRRFKSQDVPEDHDVSESDVAHHFMASAEHLWAAVTASKGLRVEKLTLEIFTHQTQLELSYAPPSATQARRQAQAALMQSGLFSAKELRAALLARLHLLLAERNVQEADDSEQRGRFLDMLLAARPELLREAQKRALAAAMTTEDAEELPPTLESDTPLITSRLNVYGVYPGPPFNSWEKKFGEGLDADTTNTVLWWHRNLPRKPYSINVLMENGSGFFPDFIVGIRDRRKEQNGLLADTKHAWDMSTQFPKVLAEHAAYGRVAILTQILGESGWKLVGPDASNRARIERPFMLSECAKY